MVGKTPLTEDQIRLTIETYLTAPTMTDAARSLGMTPGGLVQRMASLRARGYDVPKRHDTAFKTTVQWTAPAPAAVPEPVERPEEPPGDPIEIRRLRDKVEGLLRQLRAMERRAAAAEDIRAGVMGLMEPRPEPTLFTLAHESGPSQAETVIMVASDWHWGETIDIAAMDGLNRYDPAVARARAERFFATCIDLMTKHWSGPPPARVILVINGDMISGEIHAELTKTNALLSIPAVKDCASALMGGLHLLAQSIACPIDVISLPGNHGRSTVKPESKRAAEHSYDILVSDLVELHFRGRDERITFYAPVSGDALFAIDGWTILATHGDRIGSRGGAGFVGPAATVSRGFKRLVADYAARGVLIDLVLCGHFHVPLRLEEGYVCGTLAGPSEYSRDGRFRPHPASQLFLVVHPRRGVTQVREIQVGAPDEGSIYDRARKGRSRPRYRVPAIGRPA